MQLNIYSCRYVPIIQDRDLSFLSTRIIPSLVAKVINVLTAALSVSTKPTHTHLILENRVKEGACVSIPGLLQQCSYPAAVKWDQHCFLWLKFYHSLSTHWPRYEKLDTVNCPQGAKIYRVNSMSPLKMNLCIFSVCFYILCASNFTLSGYE